MSEGERVTRGAHRPSFPRKRESIFLQHQIVALCGAKGYQMLVDAIVNSLA